MRSTETIEGNVSEIPATSRQIAHADFGAPYATEINAKNSGKLRPFKHSIAIEGVGADEISALVFSEHPSR